MATPRVRIPLDEERLTPLTPLTGRTRDAEGLSATVNYGAPQRKGGGGGGVKGGNAVAQLLL